MCKITLYCILAFLCMFTLYMLIVTSVMGTKWLKTSQYLMSSLTYSKEATLKINLLIHKYEAGLLKAELKKQVIEFTELEGDVLAGKIYIKGKYCSYGMLCSYGSMGSTKWLSNKPDLKTFKRIVKLEKKLNSTINVPDHKSTNNSDNVILG